MRGKLLAAIAVPVLGRITPADAGKTVPATATIATTGDHPRGCGENASSGCPRGTNLGSPPRMRGKRNICTLREDHNGITPADAGKTI